MNWRWLVLDFADPELPLSWRQRMRIGWRTLAPWDLPAKAKRGRWLFGAWAILLSVLWLAALAFAIRWHVGLILLLWLGLFANWLGMAIGFGVCCRREHFHRLRLEGFEVCTDCGYWLRGLDDEARCPECGGQREAMPGVKQ